MVSIFQLKNNLSNRRGGANQDSPLTPVLF
jgi:hypothetical protein